MFMRYKRDFGAQLECGRRREEVCQRRNGAVDKDIIKVDAQSPMGGAETLHLVLQRGGSEAANHMGPQGDWSPPCRSQTRKSGLHDAKTLYINGRNGKQPKCGKRYQRLKYDTGKRVSSSLGMWLQIGTQIHARGLVANVSKFRTIPSCIIPSLAVSVYSHV
jgi:hypothetical protein